MKAKSFPLKSLVGLIFLFSLAANVFLGYQYFYVMPEQLKKTDEQWAGWLMNVQAVNRDSVRFSYVKAVQVGAQEYYRKYSIDPLIGIYNTATASCDYSRSELKADDAEKNKEEQYCLGNAQNDFIKIPLDGFYSFDFRVVAFCPEKGNVFRGIGYATFVFSKNVLTLCSETGEDVNLTYR